jgi:D-sedoheptulose 7-phosphate isomerase
MVDQNFIRNKIIQSIEVKKQLLTNENLLLTIEKVANQMVETFKNGDKVLFCGNGGSAADAQHISAELSGRFYKDREPLYAEALHVNSSYIPAVANDYSFDDIYSRMIKAMGRKGDLLVGISTSGNSNNIIKAIETANTLGMTTVGLTGFSGGKLKDHCSYLINIPSSDTPRIQESHILIGHILCEIIENLMFKE